MLIPSCFGSTRSGDKPNVLRTAGGLYIKLSAADSEKRYLLISLSLTMIINATLFLLVLTVSQGGLFGILLLSFLISKITAIAASILNLRSVEILETRQPPEVSPQS